MKSLVQGSGAFQWLSGTCLITKWEIHTHPLGLWQVRLVCFYGRKMKVTWYLRSDRRVITEVASFYWEDNFWYKLTKGQRRMWTYPGFRAAPPPTLFGKCDWDVISDSLKDLGVFFCLFFPRFEVISLHTTISTISSNVIGYLPRYTFDKSMQSTQQTIINCITLSKAKESQTCIFLICVSCQADFYNCIIQLLF